MAGMRVIYFDSLLLFFFFIFTPTNAVCIDGEWVVVRPV
jgi:hypothetical protein